MSDVSAKSPIKVLVVDDSMFICIALKRMLEADPEIKVVGTASNGLEAIKSIKVLNPDVVTMDIEMPQMDGLTALEKIMAENPLPILMISTLTESGAEATIKALSLGALDYIGKQIARSSLDIVRIQKELQTKIKLLAKRRPFMRARATTRFLPTHQTPQTVKHESTTSPVSIPIRKNRLVVQVVAIGTSTGGPKALQEIIPQLPAKFPSPILIVQHMPAFFTKSLAERLDSLSQLTVKEAQMHDVVEAGKVLIAPGGQHMTVIKRGGRHEIRLSQSPKNLRHKPSVDVMLSSVAEVYGSHAIGVILTGMGHDGLEGLTEMHHRQGFTLAQDESTSVIYGMPKVCIEKGIVDGVLPVDRMSHTLIRLVQKSRI